MPSARAVLPGAGIFVLALVARLLIPVLSGGGFHGRYDYDPSVYYAAADAMLSGLAPYKDFFLVHPPLLPLVLTPFAAIGRATTDHTGFVLGNLAFTALGALNAVLAWRLGLASGLGRRGAFAAGAFYAAWFGAVNAEFTMRLEPLGNTLVLLALLALCRSRRSSRGTSAALAAGVFLGLAESVKIWWVLPIAVVVAESLLRRRWRDAALLAAGAVGAVVVVCAPFYAIAGHRMWAMVVQAQGVRERLHGTLLHRFEGLTIIDPLAWRHGGRDALRVVVLLLALLAVAALIAAARLAATRVFVALVLAQGIAIVLGPAFFPFYDDWLAIAAAMVVGAAVRSALAVPSGLWRRVGVAGLTVGVALTCLTTAVGLARQRNVFVGPISRTAQLAAAARRYGCMQADDPMLLVEADALTRSFAPPCHDVVDVSSPRLGFDGPRLLALPDHTDPGLERYLVRYLTSGGTAMVSGSDGVRPTRRVLRAIRCGGVVVASRPYPLYRISPCTRRLAARVRGGTPGLERRSHGRLHAHRRLRRVERRAGARQHHPMS